MVDRGYAEILAEHRTAPAPQLLFYLRDPLSVSMGRRLNKTRRIDQQHV